MDMGDICDRYDLHPATLRVFDAERLVQAKLAYAELLIKLCHFPLKIGGVRCTPQPFRQMADAVPDAPVEDFSASSAIFIIHEDLHTAGSKILLHC